MQVHWLLVLGLVTSAGFGTTRTTKVWYGAEALCEKWRSDINVLHETVSKIRGTWKQTIKTIISPVLTNEQTKNKKQKTKRENKTNNKKKTLSFPLLFSHLYSKNALFFCF